jgi:hypothetical protein
MELVRWDPWVLWPLEGTAVGLLAGAAAWCFDESAAVVVDVAPRGLAWRTAARTPAVLVLTAVWCGVVAHAGDSALFGRSAEILIEGLVALAVGSAYASCRRAWGEPVPGLLLAAAVVPVTSAWALVRPFEATLPVFPYGTSSANDWTASTVGWLALGALSLVLLTAALLAGPWWSVRLRRSSDRLPRVDATRVGRPRPDHALEPHGRASLSPTANTGSCEGMPEPRRPTSVVNQP